MHYKEITSTQNQLVKQILVLKEKSKERRKTGRFVIEGQRELQLALQANYTIQTLLFYPELVSESDLDTLIPSQIEHIIISKEVFQKLAYRHTTEGIIAIAETKPHHLDGLTFQNKTPLVLIAEAPEKPGNIGAILRTADAANVDAVIIANPKSDLYNPNIIRSSVGCVFTNQIAVGNTSEIITFLKHHQIAIFCAALQASVNYYTQDFTAASAIVVGTEATGLSDEWLAHARQNIIIPMQGEIDSMNVSVAAGILIFEAKRQRGFL
ncbi:TrmH family RNA methyltransferase [Psychroserpens algicola]|uniref:RNA methyltransferase n=1 Tax=Psychroserpens algicola TaxID=1719034 RepID=A0ABT0HAT8_9FLAO|nr:RNA methyltransferase [Psychroserpens algicola]MCK8481469.1 RNA methyltransferase [Psychroserpens algicola]